MSSQYTDSLSQGRNGGTVIADTTATTGDFGGLLVVEDAVINTWTCSNLTNAADLEDSVTLPAGLYLPARFTAITLTSGTVIAYTKS